MIIIIIIIIINIIIIIITIIVIIIERFLSYYKNQEAFFLIIGIKWSIWDFFFKHVRTTIFYTNSERPIVFFLILLAESVFESHNSKFLINVGQNLRMWKMKDPWSNTADENLKK